MFRRSSKLTAMLVAAAAVVSIVPASAAEKLESRDGTIKTGIAYDGGYIFDGYKTDDDDQSLYYNNGSKDVNIDEDDDYDYSDMTKYGSKYALVRDGSDQYKVDLSNGKIDDDESVQDRLSDSQSKLRTALKKSDRYGKDLSEKITLEDKTTEDNINLTLVDGAVNSTDKQYVSGKLNDIWYMYTAKPDNTDATKKQMVGNRLFGFTNESGKYIDASDIANIYVYSPAKGKTVKISEYGDKEDSGYNNGKITAKLEDLTPLTQDKDYIYAVAKVKVINPDDKASTDGKTTDNTTEYGINQTQYFLQKISKEQGDKKDGAYVPKSVTSYQIDGKDIYGKEQTSDDNSEKLHRIFNDDDMDDASKLFPMINEVQPGDDYKVVNYSAKNGNILVTGVKEDSVKVYTLKLKKAKIDAIQGIKNEDNTEKQIIKDDVDVSAVIQADDADQDLTDAALAEGKDNTSNLENTVLTNSAISIDSEGNTWALDKGTIYKFDGSDFKAMYTCDRSLNSLDVYDDNNLIAWDTDGDVFASTIKQDGDKEEEPVAPVVKTGWDKNADGTWSFYKDGAKATGWLNDNGTWYYLDANGTMKTGWVQAGAWYYLNASGAMQTGWINDNGTWYYCNASGAMQTGWLLDGSTWYYLNANGSMAANTTVDGYVLGANGAWIQ